MYWHESDKEKNFVWKYILDDWDVNLEEWKDGKQEKIDKYNRWKGQNKEKYERIINEISDFIFKPIKSSDETNI
jgi:hypothetical protein